MYASSAELLSTASTSLYATLSQAWQLASEDWTGAVFGRDCCSGRLGGAFSSTIRIPLKCHKEPSEVQNSIIFDCKVRC